MAVAGILIKNTHHLHHYHQLPFLRKVQVPSVENESIIVVKIKGLIDVDFEMDARAP